MQLGLQDAKEREVCALTTKKYKIRGGGGGGGVVLLGWLG